MDATVYGISDKRSGNPRYGLVSSRHQLRLLDGSVAARFDWSGITIVGPQFSPGSTQDEIKSTRELLVKKAKVEANKGSKLVFLVSWPLPTSIVSELLESLDIDVTGSSYGPYEVTNSSFAPYLFQYGNERVGFVLPESSLPVKILARPKNEDSDDFASALTVSIGKGSIYFLPSNIAGKHEVELIESLLDSLRAESESTNQNSHPIAESFTFTNERLELDKKIRLEKELSQVTEQIQSFLERKDILFLRDDPLAERLAIWLKQYLDIETSRIEEYREDFWIVDNGNRSVICEVKGLTGNIQRQHISQLDHHRDARELDEDFPALLIANTFANAPSEDEKARQRITPTECKAAVRRKVLVTRTIDLIRLLDLVDQGKLDPKEILRLFTTECGWLKVERDRIEVVRE